MEDGIIELDSEAGEALGFVSSKFEGYLWKNHDAIIISRIRSKRPGNFRQLVETILNMGFRVDIPNPICRMWDIVLKNGYTHRLEMDEFLGEVNVWSMERSSLPTHDDTAE